MCSPPYKTQLYLPRPRAVSCQSSRSMVILPHMDICSNLSLKRWTNMEPSWARSIRNHVNRLHQEKLTDFFICLGWNYKYCYPGVLYTWLPAPGQIWVHRFHLHMSADNKDERVKLNISQTCLLTSTLTNNFKKNQGLFGVHLLKPSGHNVWNLISSMPGDTHIFPSCVH